SRRKLTQPVDGRPRRTPAGFRRSRRILSCEPKDTATFELLRGGGDEVDGLRDRSRDGVWNVRRRKALPEHVPLVGARHAVALLEVKGEDGVVGARSPEEGLVVGDDQLPEVAPESLALRFAFDGELAEIRAEGRLAN